jgi:hypothetical protein
MFMINRTLGRFCCFQLGWAEILSAEDRKDLPLRSTRRFKALSLQCIAALYESIGEHIDPQTTATHPPFDHGCTVQTCAEQGIAKIGARLAQLHATQPDRARTEFNTHQTIEPDASSHQVAASGREVRAEPLLGEEALNLLGFDQGEVLARVNVEPKVSVSDHALACLERDALAFSLLAPPGGAYVDALNRHGCSNLSGFA